ncbi:MAG: thioredoxin [Ruminococcus sp.]|nr:thioredoxin [Ruminococcus sp.]MBQ3284787.1 thioredoxin [Ruminococcus sp.]
MSEIVITGANFETEVLNSDKPVLLDFWASWCGPCRMQGPILSEFAEKHPEIKVGKVNVDEEQALAMSYGVMSIPMLAVFKGGKLVNQAVGVQSIEALELLTK